MTLAQEHIQKGAPYKAPEGHDDETAILEKFNEQSEEYEKIVREANMEKTKLRKEIAALEVEIRELRDSVADK